VHKLGRGLDYRDVGEDFRATLAPASPPTANGSPCTRFATASPRCRSPTASTSSTSPASSGTPNANITLEVYAHLFQRADHAATARAALDASYAAITTANG
jgi:hypothetical protein